MRKSIILATLFAPTFVQAAPPSRPYLTLDAAQAGIGACLAYAREEELRVAVTVLDRGGRMVAFARMDDVFQKQVELSAIKAGTAAMTPISTKRLAEVTGAGSPVEGLIQLPGVSRVEGGVPIRLADGYSVGGIGVSGASPEQDGVCAAAAVDAVVETLEG